MKGISWLALAFSAIGGVLLALSLYLYGDSRSLLDEGVTAEGKVIKLLRSQSSDGGSSYRPLVVFIDETGRRVEIESRVGSNPPAYQVGERVEMLYRTGQSHEARIKGFVSLWLGTVITGVIGVLFFGVGLGILLYQRIKGARGEALRSYGRPIQARYEGVERNTRVRVNGRCPYVIVAQWQDPVSKAVHLFQSDNLWFNPEEYVHTKGVTVYIDPKDPGKYHMDTSFLPKLAD